MEENLSDKEDYDFQKSLKLIEEIENLIPQPMESFIQKMER